MKIRSFISAAIVSTAAIAPFSSRADILSWTYAPSSKDDHGAKTIDGVTITPTYSWVDSTETSFAWTDSSLQIGVTGKAAYGVSYSIPASSFDGGITKVTLTAKVAKALNDASDANKSKVSVSVGGIALSPATTNLTSTATAYEFTSETTLSGEMVLSISSLLPKNNKTSYALYVQSIVVTYDDSSSSGGGGDTPVGPVALNTPTDLAVSSITASGFTLSWMGDEHADSYEVEVLDGQGNAAGSVSGSVSPSGTVWTGLSSDTTYSVRVKALAAEGSEEYEASAQSEPKSVTTALAGGLVRKALFHDTFDNVPGTAWSSSGTISGTDEESWTWGDNAIRGPKGIRLGTGTNPGAATTREISIETSAYTASVTLSFRAASYTGKQTTGTVTLIDMRTNAERKILDLTPGAMTNGTSDPLAGGTEYSETITVPSSFKLRFESLSTATDHRLMLDDIVVTQVYDPNYATLAAPANVEVSDIGKTSFSVSWDAVPGAAGYEVWLDERFAESCESTETSITLSGLSDGTEYSVQVRALGDGLHFGTSPFSAPVSATTLEDAQKIVFAVTGAPEGDVYAGDAVSFTVTAAGETSGEAAEVNCTGLADATFDSATGAFSWTPSESDVGSHTATFTSGEYSTTVTITVVSATREETIFAEDFTSCESTWSGQGIPASGRTLDDYTDTDGWTGEHLYNGPSAIRLGNVTYQGWAQTPGIDLYGGAQSATVAVSFHALSNSESDHDELEVLVIGASGSTLATRNYVLVPRGAGTNDLSQASVDSDGNALSFSLSVSDAPFKLKFTPTTSKKWHVLIDSIRVTQTVSAKIKTLETPEALALADGTTAGESGFTVTWTPVDGATGYDVRVLDASGATAGSVQRDGASAVVSGLADDTAYTVQVRATGDAETYYPSAWSEAVSVTTARSALHPTLSFGAWQNEVDDGKLYASTANSATVSATLGDGAPGTVTSIALSSLTPAQAEGATGPTLAGGTLAWTPDEADAKKTFTLAFAITVAPTEGEARTWTETVEATVAALPALEAPADLAVNAATLAWNRADFTWTKPFRAVSYTLRVWSGAADPDASGTTWSEDFESYQGTPETQPSGWTFDNGNEAYKSYNGVHVGFKASGSVTSPEISGTVNSLSFNIRSVSGTTSTLSVLGWNGTEWVKLGSYTGEGLSTSTSTKTIENLAGAYNRFKWEFSKVDSNCAFGSVVLTGTGLPVAKVRTVEIAPGDTTSATVVPAAWGAVNYADITAHDAGDASQTSGAIQFSVPEQPPSVRATVFVVR